MRKFLFVVIAYSAILTSCSTHVDPPTPEQLFEKYKNSVVNIDAEYYYSARLSDSMYVYFTDFDGTELKNLSLTVNELEGKMKKLSGKGTFVSDKGEILTNRFVTGPSFKESALVKSLDEQLTQLMYSMRDKMLDINSDIEMLKSDLHYLSGKEAVIAKNRLNNLIALSSKIKTTGVQLVIDYPKLVIRNEIYSAKITYPFSSQVDEATMESTSTDRRVDMTMLRLKNKKTPSFVKSTFNFDDNNPNNKEGNLFTPEKEMAPGKKLYAIDIDVNNQSVFKEGEVSFKSNRFRVIYTLELSNGCPVFDEWGNLISISNNVQENGKAFNYGTISTRVFDFSN